jgi:hypothetical protein
MLQAWPRERCVGFVDLPVARPTRIVVAADEPSRSDRDALLAQLEQAIVARGATRHGCRGPGWLGCWASGDAHARNLLVVLAGANPPSAALEQAVDEWLAQDGFEALGVLSAGADADVVLPTALRRLNAIAWRQDPLEAAPQLIDTLLLDAEDRRVFVSYARSDGTQTADQVFDVLVRARFDVFLDRFRLPPGSDFLNQIEDEIVDKAMVVVVETWAAAGSHWVQHEVAMAAKRGVGLAAVNLDGAPETREIGEDARFRGGDADALAAFLLEQHRVQLSERRESLRGSVWQALLGAGAAPAEIAETPLGFALDANGRRCVVGVCVRPADLHRFRLVQEEADPHQAFVVHPPPMLHRRRRDVGWLCDRSGMVEVDEGLLAAAARTIVGP